MNNILGKNLVRNYKQKYVNYFNDNKYSEEILFETERLQKPFVSIFFLCCNFIFIERRVNLIKFKYRSFFR
jgi:hypothetical protein